MTDSIQTRHKETGRIQAVTADQLAVFSDVLEEITEEEAEQARLDAILNPPTEGEQAEVVDTDAPSGPYPSGDPDDSWKVPEVDAWAADREIELAGNKPEKLARIADIIKDEKGND